MKTSCWMTLAVNKAHYLLRKGKLLIAASLFLLLAACSKPGIEKIQGSTMGTQYHVAYRASNNDVSPDKLQTAIQHRLDELELIFSTYKPDSEINKINQLEAGESLKVSPEMFEVLALSAEVWRQSKGAFDPTVGPLVDLWGFGATFRLTPVVPAREQINQLRAELGFDKLLLDKNKGEIYKNQSVKIDLSAIAKGYAVDQIGLLMEQQAVQHYLIEVGGELKLKGFKDETTAWKIAIEKPVSDRGQVQKAMILTDIAVATSGDYRNHFELEGKEYSHTINPTTGYPIEHQLASVTVLHGSAAVADAWATAINVLGLEQGVAAANQQGLPVFLIVRDKESASGYRELMNSYFKSMDAVQP